MIRAVSAKGRTALLRLGARHIRFSSSGSGRGGPAAVVFPEGKVFSSAPSSALADSDRTKPELLTLARADPATLTEGAGDVSYDAPGGVGGAMEVATLSLDASAAETVVGLPESSSASKEGKGGGTVARDFFAGRRESERIWDDPHVPTVVDRAMTADLELPTRKSASSSSSSSSGSRAKKRRALASLVRSLPVPPAALGVLEKSGALPALRFAEMYMPIYMQLSKFKLASLVALSAAAGFAVAPVAFAPGSFVLAIAGTGSCIAAANTLNQWFEVPFDTQMLRTANRSLPTGRVSPVHALGFAATMATLGTGILCTVGGGWIAAALGFSNIVLYSFIYTPLKRITPWNTWVGAVVGAIPPLMGWAAACGSLSPGAFVVAALLYSWQFPHFFSLAWRIRADYARAGYQMLTVTNPEAAARASLRHGLALVVLPAAAWAAGVTTGWFALDGAVLGAAVAYRSWAFADGPSGKTANELFMGSLWYLPAVFALMIFHKAALDDGEDEDNAGAGEGNEVQSAAKSGGDSDSE